MSNNIIQINKHLDEFTKCYICLGKLVDATMCPNCQKLSCQKCIQKWIIERKSQCPHCRMSLKLNQIISVRFINELNSVIENLNLTKQKAKQEVCPEHNITLLYFCITCNESLCSDCFMFETKHKEHKIEKLENIYNTHCVLIKNESKKLKSKCDKFNNYLKLLNEKIIFVRNYKTERSIELEEVFDKMKSKLESLMHEKLTKLINSKNIINDKLKFLDNIKDMIESELNEAPKSELISKSENIIRDLKEIEEGDEMKSDILNISLDLPSDIHPPYESGCFVIKDYKLMVIQFQSQVQNNNGFNANSNNNNGLNGFGGSNEVLYSEDLKSNGLIWRLKVYPFGNGAIKGEFVSVFLELRDGLAESSKYFYKIEIDNFYKDSSNALTQSTLMPNFIGKRTNFWKEFSSDFQNGECWGYNKFYRIEDLEKDGFIDETGKIVFRFYVRPQTYAQLCRDQKNYIKSLEKNNQTLVNQINKNLSLTCTNKENFLVENFNNSNKNFNEKLSSGMKQKHDDQMEKDDCDHNDSNKMQISNNVDSKINSPGLNNKLHSNRVEHSENNFDNNFNNNDNNIYNNNNLIEIENEYLNNNDEENCKSENISPIITANNIKDKMEIDTEDTNPDISNNIFNTQIRLKKSQSVIVPNNKANASQNIIQKVEDSNVVSRNNNFVLNENQINQLYAGNSSVDNNFTAECIQEDNKIKEQKINAINTLTVNCDNIDEFNSDNFHTKANTSINNNINKYSILNHICENNLTNHNNNNNNNRKEKINDQQMNQEELTFNSKRDNKVNFPLNKFDSDVIRKNYNSSAQGKKYDNHNTINNNEINESGDLKIVNNQKINKDLNLNYKSNQNKIMNALSNLNNNINNNNNNNNTNLNNRYSKISNINTTNLNSNYASFNFNYKNNNNNYIDHEQNTGSEVNKNAHINNNQISVGSSMNNFLKGKLLKNSNSINNTNDNNTLQNSQNSLENYNKQKAENQLIHPNSYSTEANDLALSNQNQKINNLRVSADNIGSLSNRRETSNTSRNNSNLNNDNNNNKHLNFPKMEISTENKDDVRDEEHNFFLNYSEIKISKGLEDKQDTYNNNNINNNNINLISQLKSENAEVESEPIIITEINYKDLINKKVKNKLLKCEKLLNEIKVKDDSVKIINSNNNNNLKSSNYSNTSLINKNKTNNPSSISNTNNVNLNASNNFNNFNCNTNSNHKAKNSIQNLQEQQQNIEKELFFNPLEINERNSNMNKNLILDISENLSQENNLNDSLGSLMESMKMMDDNSFYDQHILNLQKIKRAKDVFEDTTNPKSKAVKDSKIKNNVYKEDKSNREKNNDNFNLYPENQFFNNRHPSPFLSNNHNNLVYSNNKRNVERNLKDPFGSEILNEKLKRLISKKKK